MDAGEWTIPVATLLLGQLSIFLLEWFRHWMTRRQRIDDARADFQRETLLELQDTLDELARDVAVVIILQVQHGRLPFQRADVPYDNPHAIAVLRAGVRLKTLAERVENEHVRALADQLDDALRSAVISEKPEVTTEAMDRFRTLRRQANQSIGTVLRSL